MLVDGCSFVQAVEMLTDVKMIRRPPIAPTATTTDNGYWLALWKETLDPRGTLVERYLAQRPGRLVLPPDCTDVRFHPSCPFRDDGGRGKTVYSPAMIALVRDIVTNEPRAIYRTAIDQHGNKRTKLGKNGRMSLGPTRGGAVKLTPDAHVTIGLGVGEGLESTLALQRIPEWKDSPVWALLYDSGITYFPVLPGIETLVVAVDNDPNGAGQAATLAVVERWDAAGCEVIPIMSDHVGEDLNDVVGGL
jgi:hypothetical protein